MSRPSRASGRTVRLLGATTVAGLLAASFTTLATAPAQATDWSSCLNGPTDRQAVFDRAAARSGVPRSILLGVSFMESRWDDHRGAPSTSAGYGPMHLTSPDGIERAPEPHAMGKGDDVRRPAQRPQVVREKVGKDVLSTLAKASRLTGVSQDRLQRDAVANVCGGAAVLAQYQREAGGARDLGDWAASVARYSGADDQATALRFAKQVFSVLRTGESRTTNDGQRMVLAPSAGARVDKGAVERLGLPVTTADRADCPADLACDWLPSPYAKTGSAPTAYGHYDLGNRPKTGKIQYIVLHDTEATWNTTLQLINTATYAASWHYSMRSADGHIAQHVANKNVAWHAGNWYVNMHSIGIEQEGFAADGASWFTESLYQNSAKLVKHLAAEYDIPLDRAHIIGHDQVPGTIPSTVAGMHWDPGPYWDWQHYFDLLGAPIVADRTGNSDVVTVAPGFDTNVQPVTGCDSAQPSAPCAPQGTNFVYLHTQPDAASPLVADVGLHSDGRPSSTYVSDIGARAAAGQKFLVSQTVGDWTAVWYLGQEAWIYNPATAPVLVPSRGQVVWSGTGAPVPVYGRAYPEKSAYPTGIPYQAVTPLQYSIQPGQAYVLADKKLQTDYYRASTYNCSVQPDCVQVKGEDKYYEIWFGHRIAFVRAADVVITNGLAVAAP